MLNSDTHVHCTHCKYFVDWIESQKCYFGGGVYPVDENGNSI